MSQGPFGFGNFDELPDEIKQQISEQMAEHRAHMEHHEMANSNIRHQVYKLFEDQSQENLQMLIILLHSLGKKATYWAGYSVAVMHRRFNLCPADGQNHDEELKSVADPQGEMPWEDFVHTVPDDVLRKMNEYNVNFIPNEWPKVRCERCGMMYVSLEDRMLRDPEACAGCFSKSAHG